MAITLNPVQTTNAPGSFSITLDGLMQGMALDDPAARFALAGGMLDPAETLPMWGGVPIGEYLVTTAGAAALNPAIRDTVKRATSAATMTGISVFNQNHAMLNTPQSPVPLASNGMLVNYYRNGSGARIPMQADPALISTLSGVIIGPTALYWDVVNYRVTATAAGNWALPTTLRVLSWNAANSMVVTYNGATGFATWTRNGPGVVLLI
jgi:hypothetical protein